jgi:TRAP-type mannitol/chloroaromatic compound transport system permease large subunit
VIGVTSESMQTFKVDTFRRSFPTNVVFLRFLITGRTSASMAAYKRLLFVRCQWDSIWNTLSRFGEVFIKTIRHICWIRHSSAIFSNFFKSVSGIAAIDVLIDNLPCYLIISNALLYFVSIVIFRFFIFESFQFFHPKGIIRIFQ